MTGYQMKRRIAAALLAAMMSSAMPFGALAEAIVPEQEQTDAAAPAMVEAIAPQYTKIQASAEVDGTSITVYASGMSNPVIRAVLDGSDSRNMNGTRYTFEDVAPGEHTVQVRYNAPDTGSYASDVIAVTVEAPKAEEPAAPVAAAEPMAAAETAPAVPVASEPVVTENVQQAEPPKAQIEQLEAQIEKVPESVIAPVEPVTLSETIVPETVVIENVQQAEPPKAQIEQLEAQIEKVPQNVIAPVEPVTLSETIVPETVVIENMQQAEPPKAQIEQLEAQIEKVPETVIAPIEDDGDDEPVYSKIDAAIQTGADSITVTIVEASGEPMYIAVGEAWETGKYKGDSVTFDGLEPGEYDVEVDYEEGTNVFRTTATIEAPKNDPVISAPSLLGSANSGTVQTASETEYKEFGMSASVKDGIITVTVTGASDGKWIAIEASANGQNEFNAIKPENGEASGEIGKYDEDTEEFTALDAGEYTVRAYYEENEDVCKTTTVTVAGSSTGDSDDSGSSSGGTTGGDSGSSSGGTTGDGTGSTGGTTDGSGTTGGTGTSGSTGTSGGSTAAEEVKTFTVLPVVAQATVSVVIDGASDREIEILLLDAEGQRVGSSAIIGDGLVKLGEFANGAYTIRAQYVTPVQTEDGGYDFKTVTAQAVVRNGEDGESEALTPVDIQAKIEKGADYFIITVTEANDQKMMVSVDGFEDKEIEKGKSLRYDGLTPGESYGVEIDYINYIEGAKKFAQTVTIDKPEVLGAIKITGVTVGTNMLTVSGTATAGKQIILTTTPAAASDVYAMPGENGVFSAQIACAAGTYTAVTAKYSADTTKSDTATGSWVVAAPAVKPTLTVDAIDTTSTTVIGKTTAGTIVEIKTGDYTQKVTADADGIVRFSLPHTYAAGTTITFVVYYGDNQSFSQTAKVDEVLYLGTLEYGDKSDAVKTLTKRLVALGYLEESTSRYGSTVREAVRLFQRANGLDDDGIAGPKTQNVLFSVSAIPYGQDTYPTLVRGDRGYALIYTLQQRLKDLGYYTIKVDGIYGSGTQRAVREFQRVNGLSVTGKADNATQTLLYSSAAKPADSDVVTGDYTTLSRSGKYKSAVVPLQKRLRALGYYSGNIDGYFGSQTYRAVRNFQSRNGLSVTGVADPYTQQVLYSSSAKSYSGSTSSSSSSTGYRLLYWGCRGDAVKRLQQALIDAGYKSIVRTADGIFGQWTYDAVRAYQKDKGLAVDGIAGKNTQNALYGTSY